MKNKVNIDDMITLIEWVRMFSAGDHKPFLYQNLLDQVKTNKLKNLPLDISIHNIDDLMTDALKIYVKVQGVKETFEKMVEAMTSNPLFKVLNINKEGLIEESNKFERICENMMENFKFESPEVRGIQKTYLPIKMKEYVAAEEYEKAANVRDMIKCFQR